MVYSIIARMLSRKSEVKLSVLSHNLFLIELVFLHGPYYPESHANVFLNSQYLKLLSRS
jgi:hypothetical protein